MASTRKGSLTRSAVRAVAGVATAVLVAVSLVAFEPTPLPARADPPSNFYLGDSPLVETGRSTVYALSLIHI